MTLAVRPLVSQGDYDRAVEIQRLAWGFAEADLLPTHWMRANRDWGLQLGAFEGDELVGILLAYPTPAARVLVMHMFAVRPSHQGRRVGHALSSALAERTDSVRAVTWTYDPLESTNAHVYHAAHHFGAIGVKAVADYYRLDSERHAGMPVHRLVSLKLMRPDTVERDVVDRVPAPGSYEELKGRPDGARLANEFIATLAERMQAAGLVVVGFERSDGRSPGRFQLGPPTPDERAISAELGLS